ncbi:MAG: hypothetical protein U9R19_12620, partial [Bacteroidota bacterium]|nr:hypothetical protein [Bacteroidota bacterium]
LRNKNVKVLVSRQFGKNIKLINKYFIPILIYEESPEQAGKILYKYIDWIKDELNDKETGFKLFTIKNGILKSKL